MKRFKNLVAINFIDNSSTFSMQQTRTLNDGFHTRTSHSYSKCLKLHVAVRLMINVSMRLNATSSEQLLFYLSVIIIIIQICYIYLMLLR